MGAWQTYSASWLKPLLPSRWFTGAAAQFAIYPDFGLPVDYTAISGSVTFGRQFFDRSKGYAAIAPSLYLTDSTGAQGTTHSRVSQACAVIGWTSDLRSAAFDPSSGAALAFEARTNRLYHSPDINSYDQLSGNVQWYLPFLFPDAKFAFNCSATIRTSDAGYSQRLFLGGVNSVRGYNADEIGLDSSIANDAAVLNAEYRFPIYRFPRWGR